MAAALAVDKGAQTGPRRAHCDLSTALPTSADGDGARRTAWRLPTGQVSWARSSPPQALMPLRPARLSNERCHRLQRAAGSRLRHCAPRWTRSWPREFPGEVLRAAGIALGAGYTALEQLRLPRTAGGCETSTTLTLAFVPACCRGRCGYRLQDGKVVKAAPAQQHEQSRKKAKRQAGPGPAAVAAPVPPAAAKPEPEAVAQPAAAQTGDQAKTKKKKKRMHKEADGDTSTQQQPAELPAAPALAPAAEPAGGGDARGSKKEGKKKKKGKEWRADEAPSTQQQQQQQSVPVPVDAEAAGGGGSGGGSKKTKKKGKKQAEEEGDAAEQDRDAPRGQQHAQPPGAADGEQQHEQDAPPAKRRKKKATGAAAAAAGAAAGAASGSAGAGRNEAAGLLDDTEPSRWRDSNKRQDVKSGAFSKQEKETLRRAGGCGGNPATR